MTDVVADIVADVVAAIRHGSMVYCRNRFHAPWGVAIPAGTIASFHVVGAGKCWLVPDGGEPLRLNEGDVVLVPSGNGHALVDLPGRPARDVAELIGGQPGQVVPPPELVIDGDGPVTTLLCGGFVLDARRHPLAALLPPVVHIDSGQAAGTGLAAAIDLLRAEIDRTDPGAPAVIAALADLLFVYLLRAWLTERRDHDGWVRALYDPTVGGALALIHADPAHPWTVAALARAVAVPRATFSRRFTTLTGQPPMSYVTTWRMAVAARLLRDHQAPLREVARKVGYDSEFAFARAFKRSTGQAPGRYRVAAR
ncbi:MAG TPA: AraC family transcriptional regulator [Actinophytocola sp.]|uniref:AraC family transcriptional regulator n=1 Tax=Actinophytocola sp. TaxID=1872138 RepID=UPI002DB777DC|nr:AraC family transcriptional regulator [Actinophytocola sp.]HEU5475189.1 AraC family transcriptional regulator [Actinophytocola sp.]